MAENQEYTLSHLMDELNLVIRSSFVDNPDNTDPLCLVGISGEFL